MNSPRHFITSGADPSASRRSEAARNRNLSPCKNCQNARQKCSGGTPCKECQDAGKVCVPGKKNKRYLTENGSFINKTQQELQKEYKEKGRRHTTPAGGIGNASPNGVMVQSKPGSSHTDIASPPPLSVDDSWSEGPICMSPTDVSTTIGGMIDDTFSYDSPTGQGGFHEPDTETRPAAQAPQQTAAVSTNIRRAEALPQAGINWILPGTAQNASGIVRYISVLQDPRSDYIAVCDANPVFYNDLRDGVTVQRVNATTDGPSRSVGIPAQYNSHQQIMHNGPEQSIEGVMSIERNDAGSYSYSGEIRLTQQEKEILSTTEYRDEEVSDDRICELVQQYDWSREPLSYIRPLCMAQAAPFSVT